MPKFIRRINLRIFSDLRITVMWCLEALPRLEAASRQNFDCLGLGLGLEPCCLGLGLGLD